MGEKVTKAFTSHQHPPTRAASKQQLYLSETVAQHSKSQVFPSVIIQQLMNGILLANITISVTSTATCSSFIFKQIQIKFGFSIYVKCFLNNVIIERNIYMWGVGCVQLEL